MSSLWGSPLWGLLWRSSSKTFGPREHLLYSSEGIPALFKTRAEARQWAHETYGYIKTRADLRREPHGWRMPKPVKVTVSVEAPARTEEVGL